ncbi:WD40 repeat domain-containing protein [Nonomuraea gerenzanensis]|uniref:Uncharacterized protein n=1 Tax=Nonomuraea gerenzanensis TaxID=93944 RepID=A0A1M4EEU2_9ACTN|nr:WD40 repeat domain-containing protein [Nonomuraea gerenzanensis]UBU09026.1 hypothetical protein LCN96_32155 [Nonomuraea gerenzanensis]SBO97409.1 hypothetical protein BN4615_P6925 [Nonomuraea gerenzanensis]
MRPAPSAALAGLALAVLASGCADPAADRVSLVGSTPPPASSPHPSATLLPSQPAPRASAGPAVRHPYPPATSLPDPRATGAPLPATGPPRFFVSARGPLVRFTGDSKTGVATPVPSAVHDAETGAFVADIPLPPGVESSWHLVAAARDNRTFALAGRTDQGLRFFLVRLGEDGRPGEPVAVTQSDPDELTSAYDLALSADGSRLAYATALLGGGAKISVLDVATGRRRDWTTRTYSLLSGLSWAPDGRSLAYAGQGRAIAVLDLARAGTGLDGASRIVQQVAGALPIESVAHTPDGGALVYAAGHTVERVAVSGGPAQVLGRPELPPGASLSLRFSVDGTGEHLLYVQGWRAHRLRLADGTATSVPITVTERPGEGEPPRAAW